MEPQGITDAAELELADQVRRRLDLLAAIDARFDKVRGADALPHSQLAADDRATAWLQTSHQLRSYFTLASDNVRALRRLLIADAGGLEMPIHAHYPVIRAVIEAAAEAKWILEPESHRERVLRSLRARVTEHKWDDQYHDEVVRSGELYGHATPEFLEGGKDQIAARRETLQAKVRELSDAAGLPWGTTSSGMPGMVSILRSVGTAGDVPGEFAASVWRLISGLAHPSASRATNYSDAEVIRADTPGIKTVRLTASMTWTHTALVMALGLLTEAVQLYRIRRTKPHSPEDRAS